MAAAWMTAGLIGLGMALAGVVSAQDSLPLSAEISANAPADWQPEAGLTVRPAEGGSLQNQIADIFRQAIRERGWPAGNDEAAVLVFRYGVQATADPGQAPLQLQGDYGSSGDEEAGVVLRYDLRRRDPDGPQNSERTMAITVSDRRNRVLWQAQVEATVGKEGELALARLLVPKVLNYFGQDAFNEPLR